MRGRENMADDNEKKEDREISEKDMTENDMTENENITETDNSDTENAENDLQNAIEENKNAMNTEPDILMPVVAPNIYMLPGMLVHFDTVDNESFKVIGTAMREKTPVFLVGNTSKNPKSFNISELNEIGCICYVKQIIKMPGELVRVLIQGVKRGRLVGITKTTPYLEAKVSMPFEVTGDMLPVNRTSAMLRCLKDLFEEYFSYNDKFEKELSAQLMRLEKLDDAVNQAAIIIPIANMWKQTILESLDIEKRFEAVVGAISSEIELFKLKKEITGKVRTKLDKNQRDYVLREQMKVIAAELGEKGIEAETVEFTEKLEALNADASVKEKIKKEIDRLRAVTGSPAEGTVQRSYIDMLLSLPWNLRSTDDLNIKKAEDTLNRDHYGLTKVKERVLEFLSVRALNDSGQTPIICLVGPPGTGKTSIAASVARALNKKYVRICLGGVHDEAEIRGHRRTYIGAMPGRIIMGLKDAGTKNPLMVLDEIDKVSTDYKGDTEGALLEVLDPEQNKTFTDHYVDIPVDLSEVLFICTANSTKSISKPLLDRMEVIEVSSYTDNEKFHIAKEFLYPKTLYKNGLTKSQVKITDGAIRTMISAYTREAGVRNLERRFGEIMRKSARKILESEQAEDAREITNRADKKVSADTENRADEPITDKPKSCEAVIHVTEKNITEFLGKKKYKPFPANKEPEIGIVRGLAWTESGGETLQIEVNIMPGKGELIITGNLGDVMKESARIALSYVRSIADSAGVEKDFFDTHNIHLHVPDGATPKDGPSAGVTIATAIYSAVTLKSVRSDVAMTGEVSLRGRVMAIGGLKEKLLAAKKAGIKTVLIPKENETDLSEISDEITGGLELIPVAKMDKVLENAIL